MTFRACILIPCYNHGEFLSGVLSRLQDAALPVFVADDGSCEEGAQAIRRAAEAFPGTEVIRFEKNGGKGAAVIAAARVLQERGFTHFLQADADGQHDLSRAAAFVNEARAHPLSIIAGKAVYDETAPKGRMAGRRITHFWNAAETRSLKIEDAFCGFRVYPVKPFLEVAEKLRCLRMGFDIEVLVRWCWKGCGLRYLPVAVTYPADGVSHFHLVRDNVQISVMHARLFAESFFHWKKPEGGTGHWAELSEKSGAAGLSALFFLSKALGLKGTRLLFRPLVCLSWLLAGGEQKKASEEFFRRVNRIRAERGREALAFSTLRHFISFADAMLLKLLIWSGRAPLPLRFTPGSREVLQQKEGEPGKLVLVSHFGCAEACRAEAEQGEGIRVNALVFERHAAGFRRVMERVCPESRVRLLQTDEVTPATAAVLYDAVQKGEWAAIAADRVPAGNEEHQVSRSVSVLFLGEEALFPAGPYVLSQVLRCRTVILFAHETPEGLLIDARELEVPAGSRPEREKIYRACAEKFAAALEEKALEAPYQWFNFYDFWRKP